MKMSIITAILCSIIATSNAELVANPYFRRYSYFDYECDSIIFIRGRRICRRIMSKPTIVKSPKRKRYVRTAPSYPAIINLSSEYVRRMRFKYKMRIDGRYWYTMSCKLSLVYRFTILTNFHKMTIISNNCTEAITLSMKNHYFSLCALSYESLCSTVGTWKASRIGSLCWSGSSPKKIIVSVIFLGYLRFPL